MIEPKLFRTLSAGYRRPEGDAENRFSRSGCHGSFQAGVGVGTTGSAGVVNPLVNTQFQYIDVGVNVEVTPRVHPDGDVSMKLTSTSPKLPAPATSAASISPLSAKKNRARHPAERRRSQHPGRADRAHRYSQHQWHSGPRRSSCAPYFFSDNSKEIQEDETLIVLTPHILRYPSMTAGNLEGVAAGTDSNVRVYRGPLPFNQLRSRQRQHQRPTVPAWERDRRCQLWHPLPCPPRARLFRRRSRQRNRPRRRQCNCILNRRTPA